MAKAKSKGKAKPVPNPFVALNECLAADISSLIHKKTAKDNRDGESQRETLRECLSSLYTNLNNLVQLAYRLRFSSKARMAAWTSFLLPIEALAGLSEHSSFDGHFLAARWLLYLMSAFCTEVNLERRFNAHQKLMQERSAFLFDVDERLLNELREVYKLGDRRETFDWVLSEYPLRQHSEKGLKEPGERNRKWAAATSVQELRDMGAVGGRRFRRRREGDDKDNSEHEEATAICYGTVSWSGNESESSVQEDNDQDDEGLEDGAADHGDELSADDADLASLKSDSIFDGGGHDEDTSGGCGFAEFGPTQPIDLQQIGTDGPIREGYWYRVVQDDGVFVHRRKELFVRSKQFVLDARKVATWQRLRDEHFLARLVMIRKHLPFELREMVTGYLERPVRRPAYVADLDLADVFQPFPDPVPLATKEESEAAPGVAPFFVVWNLPLRAFITIHCFRTDGAVDHRPCKDFLYCRGRHTDTSWRTERPQVSMSKLESMIEGLIQSRCGPDATLASVGLGPVDKITSSSREEDEKRQDKWNDLERMVELEDERTTRNQIGIGGLLDAMMHARSLTGIWPHGATDPTWMSGRSKYEERAAALAFRREHVHDSAYQCSRC